MHPLSPNLTELKDDELHKKHGELMTRINQAWRMGMSDAVMQLQMLEEDYRMEIQRRNQKLMDDMAAKNDKYKGIINVK
jgi:hypothetical protein